MDLGGNTGLVPRAGWAIDLAVVRDLAAEEVT
jgi:hypothetical protein